MKKLLITFMTVALTTVLLTGCGKKISDVNDKSGEPAANEVIADEAEEIPEEIPEGIAEDNSEEKRDIAEEEPAVIADEEQSEAKEAAGEAGREATVSNNGGHFLGIGDDVYYLAPGPKALETSALFGEFMDMPCGESTLIKYNTVTQDSDYVYESYCFGGLYASGNKIFIAQGDEDKTEGTVTVIAYDILDESVSEAEGMRVIGSDSKGVYAVTEGYDNGRQELYVYKNGEFAKSISEDGLGSFIGIEEGILVASVYSEADDLTYIKSYDLEQDEEYILGEVPEREDGLYSNYPEYEQCIMEDGKIYLSICWYEGTGHFFAEQAVVTADLKRAYSLTKLQMDSQPEGDAEGDAEEPEACPFALIAGEPVFTKAEPNKAFRNLVSGEYGYADEMGNPVVVGSGLDNSYNEDYSINCKIEALEYVNNLFFYQVDYLERNAEEDIGWREAYVRYDTYIFCTDGSENEDEGFLYFIMNPNYEEADDDSVL